MVRNCVKNYERKYMLLNFILYYGWKLCWKLFQKIRKTLCFYILLCIMVGKCVAIYLNLCLEIVLDKYWKSLLKTMLKLQFCCKNNGWKLC